MRLNYIPMVTFSKVGLNLALGLVTTCDIVRLYVGDLHAIDWGEWQLANSTDQLVLATPLKGWDGGLQKSILG